MRRPARFAAAIVLSASWGFVDGYFTTPWPAGFLFFAILAAACLILDEARACGGIRASRVRAAVAGGAMAAGILGAQVPLLAVMPGILARAHRIPFAAQAIQPILSVLGLSAGCDVSANLLLDGTAGVRAVALTWEMAALPALLRLAVAVLLLGELSCLARNLMLILGGGALRLAGIVALVAAGARLPLAYEPMATMILLLPLCFWLRAPGASRGWKSPPRIAAWPGAGAMSLIVAGGCLGWSLAYREAGPPAAGRVLIDESRSDWEWTDEPFDNSRFGQRSMYNYSLWRSWIELHHSTRVLDRPATEEDLAGADLLVIKTPTTPYDAGTISRIERFVRDGGGLYLIGDHTNLFGMSAVLNGIAAPYGISFEYDDTFPLDHEASDVFRPSAWSPHPVLRGIAAYPFETSCTLKVPLSAEPLIIGRRLGAEPVDYGQANFFGSMSLDPSEAFGLFIQAASVTHGRGRVVAFADSTNFSNFSMLWPGRRELTLNVLDWLNRPEPAKRSIAARLGTVIPVLGVVALIAGAAVLLSREAVAVALAIWLGVGAGWICLRVSAARTLEAFGGPARRAQLDTLTYDTSLSSFRLEETSPLFPHGDGLSWNSFNAFFINSARSGLWPVVAGTLEETLSGRAAALVWPRRIPSPDEVKALAGFLRKGGRLLILDSVLNRESTTRVIAGMFGLSIQDQLLPLAGPGGRPMVPALADARAPQESTRPPAKRATVPRRSVTRGGATAISAEVGSGRLLVVFDAALLSDRSFGGVYTTPTADQVEVYEAEHEILRLLLDPAPARAVR